MKHHALVFLALAALFTTSYATLCTPYSIFTVECNSCICGADGTTYKCTDRDCKPDEPERLQVDDEKELIPYGNDALPAEADPHAEDDDSKLVLLDDEPGDMKKYAYEVEDEPNIILLDDQPGDVKNTKYNVNNDIDDYARYSQEEQRRFAKSNEDTDIENSESRSELENTNSDNFVDVNDNNIDVELSYKKSKPQESDRYAIELDKDAYIVTDEESGKSYLVDTFPEKDQRKKREIHV